MATLSILVQSLLICSEEKEKFLFRLDVLLNRSWGSSGVQKKLCYDGGFSAQFLPKFIETYDILLGWVYWCTTAGEVQKHQN